MLKVRPGRRRSVPEVRRTTGGQLPDCRRPRSARECGSCQANRSSACSAFPCNLLNHNRGRRQNRIAGCDWNRFPSGVSGDICRRRCTAPGVGGLIDSICFHVIRWLYPSKSGRFSQWRRQTRQCRAAGPRQKWLVYQAMRDLSSWSINLRPVVGRARSLARFLSWLWRWPTFTCAPQYPGHGLLPYAIGALRNLLVSVLLHEIGHAVAARWVGGQVDQIVLWPLGGLAPPQVPREAQHELLTAIAGPLVNLVICSLVATLVLFLDHEQELIGLLHPLNPTAVRRRGDWAVGLKLTFWANWVLVLVNVIPAFPLDGGRAAQSIVRYWFNHRTAGQVVSWIGKYCAGHGLVHHGRRQLGLVCSNQVLPDWVAFASLALVLFFGAKQEMARLDETEMEDEMFGSGSYDFSQGYTSLERNFDRPRRENGPRYAPPLAGQSAGSAGSESKR